MIPMRVPKGKANKDKTEKNINRILDQFLPDKRETDEKMKIIPIIKKTKNANGIRKDEINPPIISKIPPNIPSAAITVIPSGLVAKLGVVLKLELPQLLHAVVGNGF
jgi:hypothetical protein